jgi:hypothetical protein
LYHAKFPAAYLKYIHDTKYEEQNISTEITLSSTKLYDFCDPEQRGEWLDVVIALIEYLRSGENKMGFLNKSLEKNSLHKWGEDVSGESSKEEEDIITDAEGDAMQGTEVEVGEGGNVMDDDVAVEGTTLHGSSKMKRGLMDVEQMGRDTKVRRKI